VAGISYVSGAGEGLNLGTPIELLTATESLEQLGSSLESTVADETRVERVKVGVIGGKTSKAGLPPKECTSLGAWECRSGERARPDSGPGRWC
jgi:hypothetical protein